MKKGFTLIELLVVITIVVLLTAISIAGISASRDRRQAKTAAEKLKSFLTEARAQAMTPDDTSFGVIKIKFNIQTSPSNEVTWTKVCAAVCPIPHTSTFTIPTGVTVTGSTGMDCATFPGNCFFNFYATPSSIIGQIDGVAGINSDKINVSDGSDTYVLDINRTTGLITITQGP